VGSIGKEALPMGDIIVYPLESRIHRGNQGSSSSTTSSVGNRTPRLFTSIDAALAAVFSIPDIARPTISGMAKKTASRGNKVKGILTILIPHKRGVGTAISKCAEVGL
jgi:hypothetical protein